LHKESGESGEWLKRDIHLHGCTCPAKEMMGLR
jgi:hypothetical protein